MIRKINGKNKTIHANNDDVSDFEIKFSLTLK